MRQGQRSGHDTDPDCAIAYCTQFCIFTEAGGRFRQSTRTLTGVWEIGNLGRHHVVIGRSRHRSLTFHGIATEADAYRADLAASPAGLTSLAAQIGRPGALPPARRMTVAQLLRFWHEADHPWKPSTHVGYRSNVRALLADPIALQRVADLTPHQLRTTFARWSENGSSLAVVGGRFRVLRSAVGWAYDERIIETHPLRSMRGPGRTSLSLPLPDDAVRALIATAEHRLLEALATDHPLTRRRAELDLLLVRPAADTGARRGELTPWPPTGAPATPGSWASGCRGRDPGCYWCGYLRRLSEPWHIRRAVLGEGRSVMTEFVGLAFGAGVLATVSPCVAAGIALLAGGHVAMASRVNPLRSGGRGPAFMVAYGAADAVAALTCSLGVLLALIGGGLTATSLVR